MPERRSRRQLMLRPIRLPPGVLPPSHFEGIGAQVIAADVAALAPLGASQPKEVALA
jgi:hypothetical protein